MEQLPICDNWTSLTKYGEESNKIYSDTTREKLIKDTKCIPPCIFMEYKFVSIDDIKHTKIITSIYIELTLAPAYRLFHNNVIDRFIIIL